MSLLPSTNTCCAPCEEPTTTLIPGPQGDPGADGTNGTDGIDSFTTADAFFMPPELNNVTIDVGNSKWMEVDQVVFCAGGAFSGYLQVVSLPTTTSATLKNLADSVTGVYATNSASGSAFPNGTTVQPAGIQGPEGPSSPGGTFFAIANNLNEGVPATMRTNLGLGTAATFGEGITNGKIPSISDAGGIAANEYVRGNGVGIEGRTAAQVRSDLSLGTAALVDTGIADTKIPKVDDASGLATGDFVVATATGVEGKTAAQVKTILSVLSGYGLLGSADAINLGVSTDTIIAISSSRYRIDKMTLENPSAAVTSATAGMFTAAGGAGVTLAAVQALSGSLTGTSKFMDLVAQAVVGTDRRTETSLYFNVSSTEARTVNLRLYGWKFD